ncbi:hypothetical protein ABKN59_009174 [Abortiporus biennis]
MAQASQPVVLPKLDNTLGAMFIGVVIAAILYGVTCVQTYVYFTEGMRRDRWILRSLVAILWILDTLDLIFVSHLVYFFTITNYANPKALSGVPWSVAGFNIVANLNDVIIRGILIDRIWKVSKNIYLAVGLWVANLAVSAFSLASAIRIVQIGNLQKLDGIKWLFYIVYTSIASIDTVIAVVLCMILWKKRTGFTRTDSQIHMLMRYSIHTGALTSVVAIAILIIFAAMPHNFIYIAIFLALPKLYLNALLAILNARDSLKNKQDSSSALSAVQLSGIKVTTTTINDQTQPHHMSIAGERINTDNRQEIVIGMDKYQDDRDFLDVKV